MTSDEPRSRRWPRSPGSAAPPTRAPPTRRRTRSRRASTDPATSTRPARGQTWSGSRPTGPAGREAARVPAVRRRRTTSRRISRSSAARAGVSAITRSSSRTRTRCRSPWRHRRVRERRCRRRPRRRTARSTRAWRSSTGLERIDRVVNVDPRQQHREPAEQGARSTWPRPTPARAGRSSSTPAAPATPKWSETVIAGGSLGAGQAALIATLHHGAPRGAVHRLDGRQARLGHARSDAVGAVLLADPPARAVLRAHLLRVPRARPGPELPAAGFPIPPVARRIRLVENRCHRSARAARVQSRPADRIHRASPTPTTRAARPGRLGSRPGGRRDAVAEAAQRLALDPR